MLSDPRGGEAADEGDTAEAHLPKEGGAGRLHDQVLQKNSQLCEQGAVGKTNVFNAQLWQPSKVVQNIPARVRPT